MLKPNVFPFILSTIEFLHFKKVFYNFSDCFSSIYKDALSGQRTAAPYVSDTMQKSAIIPELTLPLT